MTRVVVVTGTGTDVGKTIVTAALAVTAPGRVLVVKPVQTGVAGGDPGDADVVARLAGVDVQTWAVLDEPLAPETAARRAGVSLPSVAEHAAHVREVAASYDVVVVEGAGGLLVRLDSDAGTLLDLAADLATTHAVEVVVVCAAGLGTLNVAELTVGALRGRDLEPSGLVIGSWPTDPGLAEACNREDLPRVTGVPLVGVVPQLSGGLEPERFRTQAAGWLQAPA